MGAQKIKAMLPYVLPQITYGNMALIFLSYFDGYNKNEIFADYLGYVEIFLNVATFSVTNRFISSTKKRLIF
jgi:hypothetical protein